ncbi:hypothetical protein CEXT_766151 [Caerostris extrusa]|uniref:Uncharacterized protein n=1 Tax=Caerostris extrusa TaxID=172846 RepID=A0AAV4W103_CAEEX|nr:hypothetical protein CEXT_766151 [Caerostris extrusa]
MLSEHLAARTDSQSPAFFCLASCNRHECPDRSAPVIAGRPTSSLAGLACDSKRCGFCHPVSHVLRKKCKK